MAHKKTTPFHEAELAVQERLGVADMVAEYGGRFIRKAMPLQHREFFGELPMVILGLVDSDGYPWALPLFGEKGFISAPKDTLLSLNALPILTQLLELDFRPGQKVGMLGIQLETRRRNRMNGVIGEIEEEGFSIHVEQSFGNCPQYIQTRALVQQTKSVPRIDLGDVAISRQIDAPSKALIEKADTFFIASRTQTFEKDMQSGIDASHRGGKPGFVKVEGHRLYFPDFSGNRFFNTVGNIESDGRVGLFFPDFSTGDAVFLAGRAQVLWELDAAKEVEGAERIIRIDLEKIVHIQQFMSMTGELVEFSPVLENTGTWNHHKQGDEWGFKPFRIIKKQIESRDITSFYFGPLTNQKVEDYIPGQFIPVQLKVPSLESSTLRSYTLSQASSGNTYRISVKREADGLVSKVLHDQLQVGDKVHLGKPAGQFTLRNNEHAVVFISGGVGVTPMIAMLEGMIRDVARGKKPRPVWFIHGTRNSETRAFSDYINGVSNRYPWLQVHTVFSRPLPHDEVGHTHQSEGHISIEFLKQILPFDHYDFYLCGSEGFMRSIYTGLIETGVSKTNIFYEFFGEGSLEEPSPDDVSRVAERAQIHFSKTDLRKGWTPEEGSLLEFAEKQGLAPLNSCRSGNCGACACELKSGKVTYAKAPSFVPGENQILICCARPAEGNEALVIDI